jgi:GNAT superfamily N-acetyltransferase
VEVRRLRASDDRSGFRTGDPDLDRFLHRYAGHNQFRHHIGTTYVAVEGNRIFGYATVAAGHVEIDGLPAPLRKKQPAYPLPILRLGGLAVDESARGQGLGKELLRFVLELAPGLADDYGCVGVLVDAKREAANFYAKLGFMGLEAVEGQSDARPVATPMFLPLAEIASARGRPR